MKFEIKKAIELKKAICGGVYIHKLEDRFGKQSLKGINPLPNNTPVFESNFASSSYVYNDIKENIGTLVERAINLNGS